MVDELGHDPTECFNAERQRHHVKEKDVGDIPCEHASLNRSTDRDGFIWIDAFARFTTNVDGWQWLQSTVNIADVKKKENTY